MLATPANSSAFIGNVSDPLRHMLRYILLGGSSDELLLYYIWYNAIFTRGLALQR